MHRYHPIKAVPASAREQFGTIAGLRVRSQREPAQVFRGNVTVAATRYRCGAGRPIVNRPCARYLIINPCPVGSDRTSAHRDAAAESIASAKASLPKYA